MNTVAESLSGKRITRVEYFGFSEDVRQPADWDFGEWHEPIMGLQIAEVGGPVYSVVWGHAFGNFNIELVPAPISTQLRDVGEPDGPKIWNVTDHPRWASLIADPLLQARLVWLRDATDQPGRAPIAICLWFPKGRVWIAAAERDASPPSKHWIGANEVMVIFSAGLADKLGLLRDDG
jgi:hypothetical protein